MTTERQLSSEIFDADNLTPDAAGELELPGWLRIDCPTGERTAQTSASTVRSGLGASTARAISRDGASWALLAEPVAVNHIDEQDLSVWVDVLTPILTTATTPAGATESVELEDDNTTAISPPAEGKTFAFTGPITRLYTLSAWGQFLGSAGSTGARLPKITGITPELDITVNAADADWVFRSDTDTLTVITSPLAEFYPRDVLNTDVGSARLWGIQGEQRAYPTSFIGADNVNFTRAADVLRAAPEVIAPNGFYHMVLRYRPHYSESEQAVDHNLIFFDESNRLFLRQADAKLVLLVDGAELVSAALTFSRFQDLTITIEHSATRRRLLVAGATTGNGDTVGAPSAAIALPFGWAFLLGGSSGSEEGSELVGLDFHDLSSFTIEQLADVRVLVQMDDDTANRKFRDLMIDFADGAGRYRDVCFAIRSSLDFDSASGEQLDKVGAVVGLSREGFTDDRYRVFLDIQILLLISSSRDDANWTGTVQNIVTICRKFIGTTGLPVRLTNNPPYSYEVDVPGLVLSEASLLARFLTTATYAGVLGQLVILVADNGLWDSDSVAVTSSGVWASDSVGVPGAAVWNTVITTG